MNRQNQFGKCWGSVYHSILMDRVKLYQSSQMKILSILGILKNQGAAYVPQ
jgi:hypothetical protein